MGEKSWTQNTHISLYMIRIKCTVPLSIHFYVVEIIVYVHENIIKKTTKRLPCFLNKKINLHYLALIFMKLAKNLFA